MTEEQRSASVIIKADGELKLRCLKKQRAEQ